MRVRMVEPGSVSWVCESISNRRGRGQHLATVPGQKVVVDGLGEVVAKATKSPIHERDCQAESHDRDGAGYQLRLAEAPYPRRRHGRAKRLGRVEHELIRHEPYAKHEADARCDEHASSQAVQRQEDLGVYREPLLDHQGVTLLENLSWIVGDHKHGLRRLENAFLESWREAVQGDRVRHREKESLGYPPAAVWLVNRVLVETPDAVHQLTDEITQAQEENGRSEVGLKGWKLNAESVCADPVERE